MYYSGSDFNPCHGLCPLYGGCPPLGGSVMGGSTVVLQKFEVNIDHSPEELCNFELKN